MPKGMRGTRFNAASSTRGSRSRIGERLEAGEVCWYTFKAPDKRRPVLILTRDSAIPFLGSVTIAPITSTIRNIPTEIALNAVDGLPKACAANFDNLQTVPKGNLGPPIAQLSSSRMQEAAAAISFALGLRDD